MSLIRQILEKAWEKRRSQVSQLEMFRLFDGVADGISSLYIDRIGPFCLAHILAEGREAEKVQQELVEHATFLREMLEVEAMYLRLHSRDPKDTGAGAAQLLSGTKISEAIVSEHTLRFYVRPEANVNAGIFLDTRALRAWLIGNSKDMKILNTFCFTGSLGIAAYAGGAREVVQVDSSKAMLTWARENFELNKASGSGNMRFICDDCLTFMKREVRRIQEGAAPYSTIILDPPSFGKAGTKVFSLRNDLPELLQVACQALIPQGTISISTNSRSLALSELSATCVDAILKTGRKIERQAQLRVPAGDFLAEGEDSIAMKGFMFKMAS